MIKEIKYRGLSTTPSDYECEDGHLAAAENIIKDTRMIEVPNSITNGVLFKVADGYEPIVIHTVADKKFLICWDSSTGAASSGKLGYIDMDNVTSTSSPQTPTTISTSQVYSTKPTFITPIGKTIIVNSEAGTHFYLYSGASYNFLGSHLPEIELQFGLNIYHSQTNHDPILLEPIEINKEDFVIVEASASGFTTSYVLAIKDKQAIFYYNGNTSTIEVNDQITNGALTTSENLLKNAVQSRRNNWFDACHKYNSFHHPFMVRYCYKLYDGSRVMFSSPVLMVPAVKNPIFIPEDQHYIDSDGILNKYEAPYADRMRLKANGLRLNGLYRTGDLMAKLKSSLSGFDQWKDIIASVEIYVSNYIETEKPGAENIKISKHLPPYGIDYVLSKEYSIGEINNSTGMLRTNPSDESKSFNTRYTSHLKHQRLSAFEIWHASANNNNVNAWGFGNDASTQAAVNPYSPYMIAADDYAANDINRQVKNASFYLFKEYNLSELSDDWMYVKDGVEDSYLKSLTARRAMDITYDYQSHDTRFTKVCMSYNNSYVTANNVYTKFKGFRPSTMFQFADPMEYDVFTDNTEHTLSKLYDSYTKITTEQGDIVVKKTEDAECHVIPVGGELNTYHIYPFVISYPDTQAVSMYLQDTEMPANNKFKFDLISNSIGTKFYFTGFFPSSIPVTGESIPAETPLQTTSNPNEVSISRQSNMFAYADTGINLVGNGEVRAVAVNTHALSQGQFGQYPIYVFTSDGIWVLEIDNAGIVQTISPLTRDVITADENGLGHVAQTDNTLLFPTKQGLMAIRGASVELQSLNFFDDAKDILANAPFNSVPFLAGKSMPNFNSFIANMRASFDYENKRIIVFSSDYDNIMYAWKNENSATDVIFSKYEKPSVGEQMYNRQEEAIQGKIVTSYTHATTSYIMCGTTKYEKFDMGNFESSKKRPIYPYAFVKSITNDLWTIIPSSIIETLNSYPEALVISGDNKIIDLSKISPDITSNTANTGWFLTRPISLGDPNMPKVIDYVLQNGVFGNSAREEGVNTTGVYKHVDTVTDTLLPQRNDDVFKYAQQNGAFVSDSIQQVLFGSNDLVNWVVISSSRSHRISDYSGSPYKWFRLAVKCSFKPGESLSSVTFSFRNKFSNDKLL